MWYSKVLIELFQFEISLSSEMAQMKMSSRGHKMNQVFAEILTSAQGLQFTNQSVFSFRFTNLLVFSFQAPLLTLWLIAPRGCNKERRIMVKLVLFSEDNNYFLTVI
jgi:hypothetical protein